MLIGHSFLFLETMVSRLHWGTSHQLYVRQGLFTVDGLCKWKRRHFWSLKDDHRLENKKGRLIWRVIPNKLNLVASLLEMRTEYLKYLFLKGRVGFLPFLEKKKNLDGGLELIVVITYCVIMKLTGELNAGRLRCLGLQHETESHNFSSYHVDSYLFDFISCRFPFWRNVQLALTTESRSN